MGVVGDGGDGLGSGTLDEVSLTGHEGLTLQVEVDTLLLSLALLLGVLLDTLDEVLTGAGVLDVLDADVDALLEVAVADDLVEEDTDGGLGHVVDDTGLTVVDLVGHTISKCLSKPIIRSKFSSIPTRKTLHVGIPINLNRAEFVLTPSERHR